MASAPFDPLQALQAALSAPANSKEQADLLATLRDALEKQPAPLPILVKPLIGIVGNAADSLLKKWVIELLQFSICRSTLSPEQRTQMSLQALETIAQLLNDSKPSTVKYAIQSFTTAYPLLFRYLCTNRNQGGVWNTVTQCKTRIISFLWADSVGLGVKLCAVKLVQRVILVQTRGISDPRLLNKADPSLSLCPADHPFIQATKLETEGRQLLEAVFGLLYQSKCADLLCAIVNSWSTLAKLRPALIPMLVGALKSWTPAALKGLSFSSIKSVEKTIRIVLVHITRLPNNAQYVPQITEYLNQQAVRMEKAAAEEKKRRLGQSQDRKRPPSSSQEPVEAKRIKLESEPTLGSSSVFLSSFDFTSLPASLITELIVANLGAFTEPALVELVQNFRQNRGLDSSVSAARVPVVAAAPPASTPARAPERLQMDVVRGATPQEHPAAGQGEGGELPSLVKAEPVDPLKMDIDQEEIEYEPDRINEVLSSDPHIEPNLEVEVDAIDFKLAEFKLPTPEEFSEEERTVHIQQAVKRIRESAADLMPIGQINADVSQPGTQSSTDLWMLLLVRMITRVTYQESNGDVSVEGKDIQAETENLYARQDEQRQVLCDYIMTDFAARISLANTWMNEEWYNDQIRLDRDPNWRPNYDTWLNQVVSTYQTHLDGKDRTFSRFLLDLPYIPGDVLELLRDLCLDSTSPDRLQVGFTTLRGLVIQRPSLRVEALHVLLELTTHPERRIRAAAINSVKPWVTTTQPMDAMVREFALQMLRKLQTPGISKPRNEIEPPDGPSENRGLSPDTAEISEVPQTSYPMALTEDRKPDENMDEPSRHEMTVSTPYIPERLELPAQKAVVLQYVELLFALSVKIPDLLDEIFSAYGQMDISVQEAIQDLITALVRSLGPSHGKLLTLMRTCPAGSESLALRVLTIFTEGGRASSQLVAIVKALVAERNLDARFLIPIIAEMDKPDILRHLPKIVSLLNGQPEPKNLVRSVFSSIVTTPPQTFGSVTSNLPRVRQSELLTPAELMVLLHESEKEIGLKSAIEAIGICFSMTDVFRSEILAVVMQQIMDEPTLPVLFLRTVIQAVTTYKSLVGFVSTTLLSRLITKKIWTNPPLWEGFIRCAKVIAPASFGALLQLPKDQLRELVDKQPSLKSGLRDFVMKKASNKARVAGFLDIFGETEDGSSTPMSTSGPVSETPTPEPTPA